MKPIEFDAIVSDEASIIIPNAEAAALLKRKKVHVIIVEENETETAWNNAALKHFLDSYDDEDAVYDQFKR